MPNLRRACGVKPCLLRCQANTTASSTARQRPWPASFIRKFIHSFVHSFLLPSSIHSSLPSFLPLFIPSSLPTCIHSCTHSFIHSFIHSFKHSFTHPPTHSLTHPSLTPSMNSFVVWETVKSATKQQQAKQMSTQRFWNKQHIQPCDCSHMSTAQHHCSICLQVRSCMHDSKIGKATDWNRMHAPQQAKQGNRLA